VLKVYIFFSNFISGDSDIKNEKKQRNLSRYYSKEEEHESHAGWPFLA